MSSPKSDRHLNCAKARGSDGWVFDVSYAAAVTVITITRANIIDSVVALNFLEYRLTFKGFTQQMFSRALCT